MRHARRSAPLRRLCLPLALCLLWSFAVAPCVIAAEAARKVRPAPAAHPRRFTSLADRLANTPFVGTRRSAPPPSVVPTLPVPPGWALPASVTRLDQGDIWHPLPAPPPVTPPPPTPPLSGAGGPLKVRRRG